MKHYNFERITELRKDLGLNQTQMAGILNLPQRTYAHYENGDVNIPIEILHLLARYHNTSIDYLTGLTDVRKPYPPSKCYRLLATSKPQQNI